MFCSDLSDVKSFHGTMRGHMGGDICHLMSISLLDLGRFVTLLLSFIGTFKQPSFLMWKVGVTSAFHVSVFCVF